MNRRTLLKRLGVAVLGGAAAKLGIKPAWKVQVDGHGGTFPWRDVIAANKNMDGGGYLVPHEFSDAIFDMVESPHQTSDGCTVVVPRLRTDMKARLHE
jgi:hypothetical protein